MKVVQRCGLGAKHPFAPFHVVEVDLEDALFAQDCLQRQRQQQFLRLAQHGALARQEQVLRQLLRDGGATDDFGHHRLLRRLLVGRPAFHPICRLLVAAPGFLHRGPIHAAVVHKTGVFAGDDGALQVVRDAVTVHPFLRPGNLLFFDQQPPGFAALEGGGLRVQHGHECDAGDEDDLQRQNAQQQQPRDAQQLPQPGRLGLHPPAAVSARMAARTAASTGAVSGRTPRQK